MKYILSILLFSFTNIVLAQSDISKERINASLINFNFKYQIPEGDFASRFGSSFNMMASYHFKFKNNISISASGGFMWTSKVKEQEIIDHLRSDFGEVINSKGLLSPVDMQLRGFEFMLKTGKIFPILGPNPNSGIWVQLGVAFLQHKIFYSFNEEINQLSGDYLYGYDRMTNGFGFNQSIGYLHLSNRNMFNFYIGLEVLEAFTKQRRIWDFATNTKMDNQRFDVLIGLKFGWLFTIYKRTPEDYYFE